MARKLQRWLPQHNYTPDAGKGKHIEFNNVGQNTVELWTMESGGGWIHPVHIHLVVRILDPLLHLCSKLPPCPLGQRPSRLRLVCQQVVSRALADALVVNCRTSSASHGRAPTGTAAALAAVAGSPARRSW